MTDVTDRLESDVRKLWWIPLVQGIAALLVGMWLFGRPVKTLVVVMTWVGAYWLVDGIFQLVRAMMGPPREGRLWPAVSGLIGIFGGLFALFYPGIAGTAGLDLMVNIVAVGLLVSGIVQLFTGRPMSSSNVEKRSWGKRLVGLLYIIGGAMLLMHGGFAIASLLLMFAFWLIFIGILQIFAAFELKNA